MRLAALPEGEQLAVVPDEGGVGGVLVTLSREQDLLEVGHAGQALVKRLARRLLLLPSRRADVPVAIARLAALEADAVDHAVAVEPVVGADGVELRVRPVAEEHPVESLGQLAHDLERGQFDLLAHRGVMALEERALRLLGVVGHGGEEEREQFASVDHG